ncbi:MAG: hypothetical protein SFU56_08890 [Capsulimonadales bacterium]|nr:hypothetical protein [Capsulimonadales bacterium]
MRDNRQTPPLSTSLSNGAHAIPSDGTFDGRLFHRTVLRHRAVLTGVFVGVLAVLLLGLLAFFPRRYTTVSSIAFQQNSGAGIGGSLASLANLNLGSGKVYDGVLRSRRFAAAAVRDAGVSDLYRLNSEESVLLVQDAVMTEDPKNGLTYLHVTLPGPPILAPGAADREKRVMEAARLVNDSLIASLQDYLATTNTDHDAVVLKKAKEQLESARREYDAAVEAMTRLVRSATGGAMAARAARSPGTPPSGNAPDRSAPASATDLATENLAALYRTRAELEVSLRSAEEQLRGQTRLARETASGAHLLPAEDPLLGDARLQVRQAERALAELRVTLADSNPQVEVARRNLEAARRRLREEQSAFTSDRTSAAVDIAALRTKYDAVLRQIARAEKDFNLSRDYSTEMLRRRNEIDIRLEVLKSAASQFALLNVTSVAGDGLMDVVDVATLPDRGRPGLLLLGAASVFGAFVTALALAFLAYFRESRRRTAPLFEAASSPSEPARLRAGPESEGFGPP